MSGYRGAVGPCQLESIIRLCRLLVVLFEPVARQKSIAHQAHLYTILCVAGFVRENVLNL